MDLRRQSLEKIREAQAEAKLGEATLRYGVEKSGGDLTCNGRVRMSKDLRCGGIAQRRDALEQCRMEWNGIVMRRKSTDKTCKALE